MKIATVCGQIDVDDLGVTLVHEHLFIGYLGWELDPGYRYDRSYMIKEAVSRMIALREAGVKTFVDPCPIELGRDVSLMREVSEKSGMQIICTTGFYFEAHGLPIYWRLNSAEEIAELLLFEIEHGIAGTDIHPGAIKCATGGAEPTALEYKFLAAVAIAQRASGLPIITHTEGGKGGPQQQRFFVDQGIAPCKCLIGHSCGNPDPAYHRLIAENGSYVGFDRIGYAKFQSDEIRADNIALLLRDGFGDRILISQDRYCGFLGKSVQPASQEERDRIALLHKAGKWPPPHTFLFTDFLPSLRERGVSEKQINEILVVNTKRFFSGAPLKIHPAR